MPTKQKNGKNCYFYYKKYKKDKMLCRLRQAGRTFFGKKGKGLLRQIAAKDKRKAQPEAGSGLLQLC